MRVSARILSGLLIALVGMFVALPSFAADPLTIQVVVVDADTDGVAVTFTAAGLKRGDEVDTVKLTYAGTDNSYGPSSEPPDTVGKYRVEPSDAVFAQGSASSYDIRYLGASFAITKTRATPLPTVDVVEEEATKKATAKPTPSKTVQPVAAAPTSSASPSEATPEQAVAATPTEEAAATSEDSVTAITTSTTPLTATDELPPYVISENATTIVNTQIALYSLLAAATVATHRQLRRRPEDDEERDDNERGELAGVKAGKLTVTERESGWGDRSVTWRAPLTPVIDNGFVALAKRFAPVSPLLGRTASDGAYLRAMFGSIAVLLYPLAIGLSTLLAISTDAVVPEAWMLVAALAVISMFDALAGAVASVFYIVITVATGGVTTLFDVFALLGLSILWFAPPLIASAFRPFRRRVSDLASAWERGTDYLLIMLLTHWAVFSMVTALPALAGTELPITDHARKIALALTAAVTVRLLLEDLVFYQYPQRLRQQHAELPTPSARTQTTAKLLRTALFAVVAYPFVGATPQLALATAMYAIPLFIAPLGDRAPQLGFLTSALPRGTVKTVVMVSIGSIFAAWTQTLFTDPEVWVRWSFVVLGIPGLVLSFAELFADETRPRMYQRLAVGPWVYRFGGIAMFALLWHAQSGVNLVDWVRGFTGGI